MHRWQIFVPSCVDDASKNIIIAKIHNKYHRGMWKKVKQVEKSFTWLGMLQTVRKFAQECPDCTAQKVKRKRLVGFFKPLEIPDRL